MLSPTLFPYFRLDLGELVINLNIIGKVNCTLTGLPSCVPGLNLGMSFTTLKASRSISQDTDFLTVISDRLPSSFTINPITTRP